MRRGCPSSFPGSARQQAADHEADTEGDEQARHRLLLDAAAERFDRSLAAGGEVLVEALSLVADLRDAAARRAAGAGLDVPHQRREVTLQRRDVFEEGIEIGGGLAALRFGIHG